MLMAYKHKTRGVRWQSGPLISGTFGYTGELNFYLKDNLIHITETKQPRRHADFFINQINGLVEVMTTLNLMPPPPPPLPAQQQQAQHQAPAHGPQGPAPAVPSVTAAAR